jgi:hypothetical protein
LAAHYGRILEERDRPRREQVPFTFTTEIPALVRASALEAVYSALGATLTTTPAKRGPGRPPKAAAQTAAPAPKHRGKPAKRTPEDVAKTGEAVVAYVAKNPGESVEQIGKALGAKTKELALPIIRMIEAKKLRTTGKRRGTKYFAK